MKKVVYVLSTVLLIMTTVSAIGCSNPAPAQNVTHNITGTVTGNPITLPSTVTGNATITITTPSGPQIFPISPNASTTYAGNFCTIDQLNQYVADNTTYNCTIVMGDYGEVLGIYVHN